MTPKKRTLRESYKRVRFNILQDSEEDIKESSASKYRTRSRQLNLDENLEVLEGKRKRAKVDYREAGPKKETREQNPIYD